ncbi:MAG: hypothetical protein OHK0045_01040 [Raineya sp.]
MKIIVVLVAAFLLIGACKSGLEKQSKKELQQVLPFREGKLWGLANEKGEILVKPQYSYIDFSQEDTRHLFPVFDKGKWGVIDAEGKMVIPIQFWRVYVSPNAIIVGDTPEDKSALYNVQGKLLLPAEFDKITYVIPNEKKWQNILLIGRGGKVGVYDLMKEKFILSPEYEFRSISVSNVDAEVFALVKEGKTALFNTKGEQVSDFKYQEYGGGTIRSEGYAKVQDLKGLWGVVDKKGREVVPCKYKEMGLSVCNKIIPFMGNNGKWGYLNVSNGKEIVKPEYDKARNFSSGFGEVEKNKKIGFVDTTGKLVVPLEYEGALNVEKGICFLMKGGDWQAIRLAENRPINKEKYTGGNFDFVADFAVASCKSDEKFLQSIINIKGEVLIPCRPSEYAGFILYARHAVFQEQENRFVVFSLPEGKELITSEKPPIIEKDVMLIAQNGKFIITDLEANKISEVEAASVVVVKNYIKVSTKPEEIEVSSPIDASGSLVAPPLEERYVPDVSAIKGFMSKEGKKFWKD